MKKIILDETLLEEFRKEHKLQPFRIKQIYQEIYVNSNIDFQEMTTLSKDLRTQLDEEFEIIPLIIDKILDSETTTKFSFTTHDWHTIESVLMYHYHETDDKEKRLNRITICLSSQIWCPVGCEFCVTAKLGFKRNLTWQEMIWQVLFANKFIKNKFGKKEDWTLWKIRNVVFMWMWEPLLNYDNLIKTLEIMQLQNRLSLSKRHITISTSWIIPWIKKLIQDWIEVMLAISLHSPDQIVRWNIMPIAQKYQLPELMEIIKEYIEKTWNRIFYEYIMIDWLTDKKEYAEQLANLLTWQTAHVNLIAYNENPAINLKESSGNRIHLFKKTLENLWVTVTIRDSLWRDVKWACWQLGYEKIMK